VLPVRQKILRDLFGPDGLTSADDTYRFDELAHNIISNCETAVPDFTSYLINTKLIPALRTKVVNQRLQCGTLPLNWTSNNCAAMNHMLKMKTNWKAVTLEVNS